MHPRSVEVVVSLLTDVLGLSETGWTVKSTNKFLLRAAAGLSIGGGRIEAAFSAPGQIVGITGLAFGLGVGAGGAFQPKTEIIRALVKYANYFKLSLKSDLYRYALTNNDDPTPERLSRCDLVLTTLSGNSVVFGVSLDCYTFYKKGEPNVPRWLWFATGAEICAGGSSTLMQYKSDGVIVRLFSP
jgi:hypothetical protein